MSAFRDLAGQKFGRLTALRRAAVSGRVKWVVRCDCGAERTVDSNSLTSGNSTSCGCGANKARAAAQLRHGLSRRGQRHPLYSIWASMVTRCTNPRRVAYRNYGGRGIRVCDAWRDLAVFVADIEHEIGVRPSPGHTLDRINNDGHYEPGNVRWATWLEQARNARPALEAGTEACRGIAMRSLVDCACVATGAPRRDCFFGCQGRGFHEVEEGNVETTTVEKTARITVTAAELQKGDVILSIGGTSSRVLGVSERPRYVEVEVEFGNGSRGLGLHPKGERVFIERAAQH